MAGKPEIPQPTAAPATLHPSQPSSPSPTTAVTPVAPKSTRLGPGWHRVGGNLLHWADCAPPGCGTSRRKAAVWGLDRPSPKRLLSCRVEAGHTVGPPAGSLCTGKNQEAGPAHVWVEAPLGPWARGGRKPHRMDTGGPSGPTAAESGWWGGPAESAGNSNVSPHTPRERVSPAHEGAGLGLGPARGSGFLLESHTLVTSVQSLSSVSLRPHGLQHASLPCPSPTFRAWSSSCPLSQ